MKNFKSERDIWVLTPTEDDLEAGARYAAISLPWTFNRMTLNTSSDGQQGRALNIAKGIVGQEMLKREMERVGIIARTQRKSYRDEDFFDFEAEILGVSTRLDLKSINYYTDYGPIGREPFSLDFFMEHIGYADANWRTFFPMLVPHTQIEQSKEAYCFAIATSIDLRKDIETNRSNYALTAFPYGEHLRFLSSSKLCREREDSSKGFHIQLLHRANCLLPSQVSIKIIGEWAGKSKEISVKLSPGAIRQCGPFSCISSFQVDKESYDQYNGQVEISIKNNKFETPVHNSSKRNINEPPSGSLVIKRSDFCNLYLPTDYTLYVIGWIRKENFLKACRQYTGWVWPKDSVDRYKNQPWDQLTEGDRKMLEGKNFKDCLPEKGDPLKAGWLKTTGRGGGACCYVFPNVWGRGGVKETNLYVLPKDLCNMNSLRSKGASDA